jgi:hypothetical protein
MPACDWCGDLFRAESGRQRFCGAKCRYAAKDRKRHVERGTRREATCMRCGGDFVYESTTRPRLYCFECSLRGESDE